jgi:hypothetical protein
LKTIRQPFIYGTVYQRPFNCCLILKAAIKNQAAELLKSANSGQFIKYLFIVALPLKADINARSRRPVVMEPKAQQKMGRPAYVC